MRCRWHPVALTLACAFFAACGEDAEDPVAVTPWRIPYLSTIDGVRQIWTLDVDTGERTLSLAAWRPKAMPVFSPDGTKIVYTAAGGGRGSRIWVADADGSNARKVTMGQEGTSDWDPAWSPDGRWLAFVSGRAGFRSVYVMEAGGGNEIRRTSASVPDDRPAWSPDGASIAYASGGDIWVMNADGSAKVNRTSSPDETAAWPAWPPDGARLAYISAYNQRQPDGYSIYVWDHGVFVMGADGSGRRLLWQAPGFVSRLVWAPDGGRVALWQTEWNRSDLWVVDVATGSASLVATVERSV